MLSKRESSRIARKPVTRALVTHAGVVFALCLAGLVTACSGVEVKVGWNGGFAEITGPGGVTLVVIGFEDALKQEAAHIADLEQQMNPAADPAQIEWWQDQYQDTKDKKYGFMNRDSQKGTSADAPDKKTPPGGPGGTPPGPPKPSL